MNEDLPELFQVANDDIKKPNITTFNTTPYDDVFFNAEDNIPTGDFNIMSQPNTPEDITSDSKLSLNDLMKAFRITALAYKGAITYYYNNECFDNKHDLLDFISNKTKELIERENKIINQEVELEAQVRRMSLYNTHNNVLQKVTELLDINNNHVKQLAHSKRKYKRKKKRLEKQLTALKKPRSNNHTDGALLDST